MCIQEVKAVAHGKWKGILIDAGLPADCLEPGGHPCPSCGGKDRFSADKNVNDSGAVFCRHCFDKDSAIKPGDGVATVAWLRNTTNGEAAKWIADRLGMNGVQASAPVDIITATCRDKRMPIEAFKSFGVKEVQRGRDRLTACRIDLYNEVGVVHSYFDLWPGDKGRVKAGEGNSGLFFPGRLPAAGETWLAVEGVKDAAALVGLGFKAFGYCGNRLGAKYARLFAGVSVIVVPDLDAAGMHGADQTAGVLAGIASSVAIARMPGVFKDKSGDDVRDVLRRPNGVKNVRDAITNAVAWKPNPADSNDDKRPEVIVTMNEAAVTDEVVHYLGRLGWDSPWVNAKNSEAARLFVRGGVLVQAIESDDVDMEGRLVVRDLPQCLVRERITQACNLRIEKETEDGVKVSPIRPPVWLTNAVYHRGSYGGAVLPLSGIIESPTVRLDGSIVQTLGYDRPTGLIFRSSVSFPPVPESPTRDDAARALAELLDVLVDFPMQDDADRSAWVSMVLTMIGRSCIDGYVPLFAVTANIRAAGKSLLVDAATSIAYGRPASRKAFTRDDDEMRKTITAIAIGAVPSVLFDNLDVQLGGAALDAAITSSTWSDRVLGQSRMTGDLPMRTIWSATGNNMAFGSDVGRRVLPIRLQSPLETPENRSGFAHPNLLAWIDSQRPQFAVAALTILRAYFVAGCPVQSGGEWGSFESWSATIRGAIVWAGGADPLPTRDTALAGDDTAAILGKLIMGMEQADPYGNGLTTKQIQMRTFGSQGDCDTNEALAEAVFEICGERFDARKFGRRLRQYKKRVWEGRYIDDESAGGGVKRWRVRRVESEFDGSSEAKSARVNHASEMSQANETIRPNPLENDSGQNADGGLSGLDRSNSIQSDNDFGSLLGFILRLEL